MIETPRFDWISSRRCRVGRSAPSAAAVRSRGMPRWSPTAIAARAVRALWPAGGEQLDLALRAHPQLDNERLVLGAEPAECERNADVIVQVSHVLMDPARGTEYRGDHLLRRRFPVGSGHRDHRNRGAVPAMAPE